MYGIKIPAYTTEPMSGAGSIGELEICFMVKISNKFLPILRIKDAMNTAGKRFDFVNSKMVAITFAPTEMPATKSALRTKGAIVVNFGDQRP